MFPLRREYHMEFRLPGRNDRYFLNPFSGFENRQNSAWVRKPDITALMIEAAEILEADRKTVNRFWGQALQKRACGCREGEALRLHPKPICTLFHSFQNIPV